MTTTIPKILNSRKNDIYLFFSDEAIEELPHNHERFWERHPLIKCLNNSKQVEDLLHQMIMDFMGPKPYAIVAKMSFWSRQDFQLVKVIRNHPFLMGIPLIGIIDQEDTNLKLAALKTGIDDCYAAPVKWPELKARIDFLHAYKSHMEELGFHDERHHFNLRLPFLKRAFDIFIASILLLTLSPLFLIIALMIKIESRGPVFYSSKRAGMGFQLFSFYKFRSMYTDAEHNLINLSHMNQYTQQNENGAGTFIKINNDPRVTRVGKIIRKTSLDELPQLFNVLKGDMSIVGNRPLPLYEAQLLTRDEWSRRFLAPAGITGLWQVSKRGKNEMSADERIQLDVDYAYHHSFWNDIKIMAKTIPAMIQEENV